MWLGFVLRSVSFLSPPYTPQTHIRPVNELCGKRAVSYGFGVVTVVWVISADHPVVALCSHHIPRNTEASDRSASQSSQIQSLQF